ncbi:erythromycin esterase family protein [Hydrogenophaga sp. ZJX-1]|uniref:erythromycin esterase family protein n=1 Tax=Hydrogenophaga sp. ZJX-1 TaxID=3404778 RepID=UPI003B28372A
MNHAELLQRRAVMVERHVMGRNIRAGRVLDAMREVPREEFVPKVLLEFAFDDLSLPITGGLVLQRPSAVGVMLAALGLKAQDSVLEIGTGVGYVTALLSRLCASVYSVEPQGPAALAAMSTFARLGCHNAHVRHDSGAEGWPEEAPFDAIVVHARARHVPQMLKNQLAEGGRLVMTLGDDPEVGELVRVTRLPGNQFRVEDMVDIGTELVLGEAPHVGAHAGAIWRMPAGAGKGRGTAAADTALAGQVAAAAEGFDSVDSADLEPLLQRMGDARVVLLGEATHGTSEFYRMRERITRELITRKGFSFVAIEGDWPDAVQIDRHVRRQSTSEEAWSGFARFPAWMWRNEEVRGFVDWLREHNRQAAQPVAFHGLDLYSLYSSIDAVLAYLDRVDPPTAQVARQRYGCLTPWQSDPASYGLAALTTRYRSCEQDVVKMLVDLQQKSPVYIGQDGERLLDALQNARVISQAERYYRTMYYGSRVAWNLRDNHMFSTLRHLLSFHGADSKAVVWAHNSHVGDSAATEMSLREEYNLGHLCRQALGSSACQVGFGTHGGTVAAATEWDAPMEVKTIRPALQGSYEHLFHACGVERFFLPLREQPGTKAMIDGLAVPRMERAIGVIYRPDTERQSHYFDAVLPRQFDEYIWFNETRAVTPLPTKVREGLADTYPFGV